MHLIVAIQIRYQHSQKDARKHSFQCQLLHLIPPRRVLLVRMTVSSHLLVDRIHVAKWRLTEVKSIMNTIQPLFQWDSILGMLYRLKTPQLLRLSSRDHSMFHGYHTKFHQHLHTAATRGKIHDVLQFRNGATRLGTLSWKCLEWVPIRRMDLQEDGSWKAISWPLPKGEVRDIPDDALIHGSVIKRMEADSTYRPGNLIVGGGGRGVRRAPADMGMGTWAAVQEEGHAVGELFVRKEKPIRKKSEEHARSLAVAPNGPQGM